MNTKLKLTIEQIEKERIRYEIAQQELREKVSPKFEDWRNHYTYKVAEGGRGAGAKSWSGASLLIQKYNYSKLPLQGLCVREFMNSLAESSYNLLQKTIDRLGYKNWQCTKEYIRNNKNGAYFIFRGLRDLKTAEQLKSYEGFDDLFADEASAIHLDSWISIVPTLRKKNKEIWVLYNRDLDIDPCHDYFVINKRPDTSYLHLESGERDNPWWNETSLPIDREADYARDPDEAEHIWEGLPRKQGFKSAISRVLIRQAMDRNIEIPDGMEQIGVDVARYGDDATEMYRRKGMKTVDSKTVKGMDTNINAYSIWDFAEHREDIPIVIDIGYNPGVADRLIEFGANVIQINFGGVAQDEDKYDSAASEMWFEFPIEEAGIPNDQQLMNELSGRLYEYDKKGRRMIESKKKFKERYKKSPDKADAILLTYYTAPLIGKGNVAEYSVEDLGI
jgi:phage terminase large subunit